MSSSEIHFIANSHYTYTQIKKEYPDKEVSIIFNPIDKNIIRDNKKEDISHPVFITISHNVSDVRKNVLTLIKAFSLFRKHHSDAELIIVGEYDQNSAVYDYANEHTLMDGVQFMGHISHERLFQLIDQTTCLVHPSIEETFGNILLEAMSRCVPCIGGQDAGAVPQVLDHGRCGVLCDVNQPEDICKAMESLQDKEYAAMLTHNATKRIQNLFASDVTTQLTIDLYKKYL